MGSLTTQGQHISQDTLVTRHTGHSIEVSDVKTDSQSAEHSLAKGGAGLNP